MFVSLFATHVPFFSWVTWRESVLPTTFVFFHFFPDCKSSWQTLALLYATSQKLPRFLYMSRTFLHFGWFSNVSIPKSLKLRMWQARWRQLKVPLHHFGSDLALRPRIPNYWMVFLMEKPTKIWMMTGGTHISGTPYYPH